MGALVASTAFGGRAYAAADPRLVGLRFLVPSESIVGAWRDNNPPARQELPVRRFDIAAGPLDAVLASFRQATGLRLRVGDEVIGTLQSPGVTGLFTVEQALAQLLAGTGVIYRFTDGDAVRLELAGTSEFVEVTRPAAIGCVTEVHRAAARRAADDQRHQQRGDGAAGRDDAARGAAQRARHHVPGR